MDVPVPFINTYLDNVPILDPLKTPEKLWFSGVFREYKMGTLAKNGISSKTFSTIPAHSWQRGPTPPYFMKNPPILPTPPLF